MNILYARLVYKVITESNFTESYERTWVYVYEPQVYGG